MLIVKNARKENLTIAVNIFMLLYKQTSLTQPSADYVDTDQLTATGLFLPLYPQGQWYLPCSSDNQLWGSTGQPGSWSVS